MPVSTALQGADSGASSVAGADLAVWTAFRPHGIPDGLEERAGDTLSPKLAVSDGFTLGTAHWHYPTKSWCKKEFSGSDILFWSLMPGWPNTRASVLTECSHLEAKAYALARSAPEVLCRCGVRVYAFQSNAQREAT